MSSVIFPSIQDTFGALLVGSFVSTMMFGVTTHQTYRYYRLYPDDKMWFKCLVAALWSFDLLHSTFSMHFSYYYLILHYAEFDPLKFATWSFLGTLVINLIVSFVTNSFHVWRLYIIAERNIATTLLASSFVIARLGFTTALTVLMIMYRDFERIQNLWWLVISTFAVCAAGDALISGSIIWCLTKVKNQFDNTSIIVDVLMTYTVNTGALIGMFNVACLVCIIVMKQNFVWLGLYAILGKLYINSILAILNSRKSARDQGGECFEFGAFGLKGPHIPVKATDQKWSNSKDAAAAVSVPLSPAIEIAISRCEEVSDDRNEDKTDTHSVGDSSSVTGKPPSL